MVIGTAGHVDHGKTSLIRCLTGVDADRLPEEKARGMTIDIGFAALRLGDGSQASIIDVPGHEKFIGNMLVGALAVRGVLLCIAADEGIRPQTEEHLAILNLLPVRHLVAVLTKADLVDAAVVEARREEIEDFLAQSRFSGSDIVAFSSETGAGKADLLEAIESMVRASEDSVLGNDTLFPIDRVFVLQGVGTLVTGTLLSGEISQGDTLELLPKGDKVKVRSIEVHSEPRETAASGSRVALGISGAKRSELERGQLLVTPGSGLATSFLDLSLSFIDRPKHGSRVRLSIGSAEVLGKIWLNDHDPNFAQIELDSPVGAYRGQPVILRNHSPLTLLAGGRVSRVQSKKRRKGALVAALPTFDSADQALVEEVGSHPHGVFTQEVCEALGWQPEAAAKVFEKGKKGQKLYSFAGLWFTPLTLSQALTSFLRALKELHQNQPTKALVPREVVVRRAGFLWDGKPLDRIVAKLAEMNKIRVSGTMVALTSHVPQLPPRQEALWQRVEEILETSQFCPPSAEEIARTLSVPSQAIHDILRIGVESGRLVTLAPGMFVQTKQVRALVESATTALPKARFTASEFKEAMGMTRKFAIPWLEYLDAKGYTRRQGDERVWLKPE
ncbi:MAG: selenocysteine-specific translation elongation factor [Fimbriimonadaceae bacterium]|jgi:selenocysteine-specific elongation factor|nr:selenocysteine-specific translation elongation factor [Fimbriimonadaceae bacterium]